MITAGGRVGEAFARNAGTNVKALAVVDGKTLLARALGALREMGVQRIAVVGGVEIARVLDAGVRVVPESPDGAENVRRALSAWPDSDPLLYVTSDLPYVEGRCLRDFVNRAPGDAFAIALAEHAAFTQRFPNAPPYGITLGGERVVNGGAFLIPSGAHGKIGAAAMRFFQARKRPLRMAQLAGWPLLVRFLIGRLRIDALESRARAVLQIEAKAVRNCAPELAYDVDTLEEYAYAQTHR